MLKNFSGFSVGLITLAALPAHAIEINESTNAYLTINLLSDYRSNGMSQTQGDPAVQSELSILHDSGALVGFWASSVDFGTKTRLETGGYAGIFKQLNDDISVTATIGRFIYPKNSSYSLNEFYGALTYKNLKYTFIYDFDMEDAPNAKYQYLGYTFSTPYDTSLLLEVGYHDVGEILYSSDGDTRNNYTTRKVSLKKNIVGIDWSISYIDTDLSKTECLYTIGTAESCSAGLVFGASKTF